jgi:hypothetical protein
VCSANVEKAFAALFSAKEVESRLSASLTTPKSVVRDERTAQEHPDLQEVILQPVALLSQGEDLLAKAASRGGVHAASDTKVPSKNLALTFGK